MLHALLVEDNDDHAGLIVDGLRGIAHVTRVTDDADARGVLLAMLPDLVITDLRGVGAGASPIDYASSLRVAIDKATERARQRTPVPLVLVSAADPVVLRGIASTLINVYALPKPLSRNALRALVTSLTGG